MTSTDVSARSVKVAVPVADADFPIGAIPPKGFPGSAKARISLRPRTPDGIELMADPAAKGLQRVLEAPQALPGGLWVARGRLAPGNVLAVAGVMYQPPTVKPRAVTLTPDVGL